MSRKEIQSYNLEGCECLMGVEAGRTVREGGGEVTAWWGENWGRLVSREMFQEGSNYAVQMHLSSSEA